MAAYSMQRHRVTKDAPASNPETCSIQTRLTVISRFGGKRTRAKCFVELNVLMMLERLRRRCCSTETPKTAGYQACCVGSTPN